MRTKNTIFIRNNIGGSLTGRREPSTGAISLTVHPTGNVLPPVNVAFANPDVLDELRAFLAGEDPPRADPPPVLIAVGRHGNGVWRITDTRWADHDAPAVIGTALRVAGDPKSAGLVTERTFGSGNFTFTDVDGNPWDPETA